MLVSLKWLKELVDVPVPLPELVDRLDLTGTAVESVKSAGAALDGVVVGQIVTQGAASRGRQALGHQGRRRRRRAAADRVRRPELRGRRQGAGRARRRDAARTA